MLNAIELMLLLFIEASQVCTALPATAETIQRVDYVRMEWRCGEQTWQAWRRMCPEGYLGRPFVLKEATTGFGFYMNRLGDIEHGLHLDADEVYHPACGA